MVIAQFATMLTSRCSTFLCKNQWINIHYGFGGVLKFISLIMLSLGIICILANNYFFNSLNENEKDGIHAVSKKNKAKCDNLWEIIKSKPHYILVALLSVYYGICTLWMEQFWKSRARILYPDKMQYQAFSGNYFLIQSRMSLFMIIFGSNILLNYMPWFVTAAITPLIVYISGFFLFGFDTIKTFFSSDVAHTTHLIVGIGTILIGLFKTVKYAAFDTTKELYLVSRSTEDRTAIKDLEGSTNRIGKSGTALVMSLIFSLFPGFGYTSPSMSIILWILSFIMATIWIFTVFILNRDLQNSDDIIETK